MSSRDLRLRKLQTWASCSSSPWPSNEAPESWKKHKRRLSFIKGCISFIILEWIWADCVRHSDFPARRADAELLKPRVFVMEKIPVSHPSWLVFILAGSLFHEESSIRSLLRLRSQIFGLQRYISPSFLSFQLPQPPPPFHTHTHCGRKGSLPRGQVTRMVVILGLNVVWYLKLS